MENLEEGVPQRRRHGRPRPDLGAFFRPWPASCSPGSSTEAPDIPAAISRRSSCPSTSCSRTKYYFDKFNGRFFAAGARLLGKGLWKGGDVAVIDGVIVNGSARLVGLVSA